MTDPTSPAEAPVPGPTATIASLLQASGIPLQHDAATLAEASALAKGTARDGSTAAAHHDDAGLPEDAAPNAGTAHHSDTELQDMQHLAFVTIDNDGSRDLDQALHVSDTGECWQLHYALADAAHYVRPGSATWNAAVVRGASLYAPDRAIAMLPESLSEGQVSLNPGAARRALVFVMHVDRDGDIERCEVLRARIRSRAQLTYPGVQRFIDGEIDLDEARSSQAHARAVPIDHGERDRLVDCLHALQAIGEALQEAQRRRGVMPFERIESEIAVSGDPPRFDVTPRERLGSERWNEQLSLACNMQGAALLEALERDDPSLEPIYRVHDAPGGSRLVSLEKTLQTLSQRLGLEGPWRRERRSEVPVADWFAALPAQAPRLKRAIQRQVLRAQSGSSYEGDPARHHALAADGYARFSSPMREIVGIHTHLVLLDALGLQADEGARDTALRDAVIASADASRARQKTLDRGVLFAVIAELFERDLTGEPGARWHDGTLLGLDSRKLHIGLDGRALDVKLYREDLEQDTGTEWTFDSVSATAADGRDGFVLGDGVRVRVSRYDAQRQRYALQVGALGNRATLADKRRAALKRRGRRRSASRRGPSAPRG